MTYRHFIVTIVPTKKPHKPVMIWTTNKASDRKKLLDTISKILKEDSAMSITVLRDCHDVSVKQDD